ncbi:MAG: alpha/beta hydrolase [Pseudomonadota bacterium]
MTRFTSHTFATGEIDLHYMEGGKSDGPLLLFLHGFPEYWAGWQPVMERLGDAYRVIAPDQRGYGKSSMPTGVDAYEIKPLVRDIVALGDHVSPDQPFVLCGHDWGSAVAYSYAFAFPNRVSRLVVANGVHPIPFQKALFAADDQTKASQYMSWLRADGSEAALAKDGFELLFNMFEKFSTANWLDEETKSAYRAAWGDEARVGAMVNWYRASSMVVPKPDASPRELPITDDMLERYRVRMPHLLIWGLQDGALLPATNEGLEQFCADLKRVEIEDGSHWVIHEHPERVAEAIRSWLSDHS